jgi:hypothetical protein
MLWGCEMSYTRYLGLTAKLGTILHGEADLGGNKYGVAVGSLIQATF